MTHGDALRSPGFSTAWARLLGHFASLRRTTFRADVVRSRPFCMADASYPPEQIGKYRIERVLGRGGMGIVYVAAHPFIEERRAIKAIAPEFSDDDKVVRRFIREYNALSAIKHENIVQIYDVEQDGNLLYYVMELLDGAGLDQCLANDGRMPWSRVHPIALQAIRGLQAVHAQGIIHRDLKPGNIILLPGDRIKIIDFGIVKLGAVPADAQATPLTSAGLIIGTPTYMSPEQASAADVDQRTDIYSLGVVLYQMLTGFTPFAANLRGNPSPLAVITQIISADPRPLREWPGCESIPENVDKLIRKALVRDPDKRFQSMGEFAAAVEAAAAPASHGRLIAATAAAIIAAAATIWVVAHQRAPDSPATPVPHVAVPTDLPATDSLPAAETTPAKPAITSLVPAPVATLNATSGPHPGNETTSSEPEPAPAPIGAGVPAKPRCTDTNWETAARNIAKACAATRGDTWEVTYRVVGGRLVPETFGSDSSSIADLNDGAPCAIKQIRGAFSKCRFVGSTTIRKLAIKRA